MADNNKAALLAEAFAPTLVRRNPQGMDYVPGSEVIARVNNVLGPDNWTIEVVRLWEWGEEGTNFGPAPTHVMAHVRVGFRFDPSGQWTYRDGVGGQEVNFFRDRPKGPVNLGDTYKGAVTDAMKKALQGVGVALTLARSEEALAYEQSHRPLAGWESIEEQENAHSDLRALVDDMDTAGRGAMRTWRAEKQYAWPMARPEYDEAMTFALEQAEASAERVRAVANGEGPQRPERPADPPPAPTPTAEPETATDEARAPDPAPLAHARAPEGFPDPAAAHTHPEGDFDADCSGCQADVMTWVAGLTKAQRVAELAAAGLETSGSLDTLGARLASHELGARAEPKTALL